MTVFKEKRSDKGLNQSCWKIRGLLTGMMIGLLKTGTAQTDAKPDPWAGYSIGNVPTPGSICAGAKLSDVVTNPSITAKMSGIFIVNQGWCLNGSMVSNDYVLTSSDNGKTLMYRIVRGSNGFTNRWKNESNSVTLKIVDKPVVTISAPATICVGGGTPDNTIVVSISSGIPYSREGWFGEFRYGDVLFKFSDNGKKIVFIATNICGSSSSNMLTLNIATLPTLSAITPPTAACIGNTLSLISPTVNANGSAITAQGWYLNGLPISSSTILKASDNGKTLIYKATNGCGTTTSQ